MPIAQNYSRKDEELLSHAWGTISVSSFSWVGNSIRHSIAILFVITANLSSPVSFLFHCCDDSNLDLHTLGCRTHSELRPGDGICLCAFWVHTFKLYCLCTRWYLPGVIHLIVMLVFLAAVFTGVYTLGEVFMLTWLPGDYNTLHTVTLMTPNSTATGISLSKSLSDLLLNLSPIESYSKVVWRLRGLAQWFWTSALQVSSPDAAASAQSSSGSSAVCTSAAWHHSHSSYTIRTQPGVYHHKGVQSS